MYVYIILVGRSTQIETNHHKTCMFYFSFHSLLPSEMELGLFPNILLLGIIKEMCLCFLFWVHPIFLHIPFPKISLPRKCKQIKKNDIVNSKNAGQEQGTSTTYFSKLYENFMLQDLHLASVLPHS